MRADTGERLWRCRSHVDDTFFATPRSEAQRFRSTFPYLPAPPPQGPRVIAQLMIGAAGQQGQQGMMGQMGMGGMMGMMGMGGMMGMMGMGGMMGMMGMMGMGGMMGMMGMMGMNGFNLMEPRQ